MPLQLLHLIKQVVPQFQVEWARYVILMVFIPSGISKLIKFSQNEMDKMFSFLPSWVWPVCGIWELTMISLYLMNRVQIAMMMSFVMYGGVFWAILSRGNKNPVSSMSQTYGLACIPVSGCHIMISNDAY